VVADKRTKPVSPEALAPRTPVSLRIAVRAFPDHTEREPRLLKSWRRPTSLLVFDTESRVDPVQRLTFGSFRVLHDGQTVDQGLFYGNDLQRSASAFAKSCAIRDKSKGWLKNLSILKRYVLTHARERIRLLTLREFLCGRKDYAGLFKRLFARNLA
jgi:hypothetical protein